MSKKKSKLYSTSPPKEEEPAFFQDSITATLKEKPYIVVRGKVGAHMTEKDRPRKKFKPKDYVDE